MQTFDDIQGYVDLTDTLLDEIGDSNFDEPSELSRTGFTQYHGVMETYDSFGILFAGAMALDVDFGANAVSGSVTDFVDFQDLPVSGTLDISNGSIDRTVDVANEYTFIADLDGTLVTDFNESLAFDAVMLGDFLVDEAYVGGGAEGVYVLDGQSFNMSGFFVGERAN